MSFVVTREAMLSERRPALFIPQDSSSILTETIDWVWACYFFFAFFLLAFLAAFFLVRFFAMG